MRIARQCFPEVTIARPSWMYGPRDRNTVPRVLKALQAGRVKLIGPGDNLINVVHVADAAAGAILAANHPESRGQAYNFSSEGELTQREFIDLITEGLHLPRVEKHIPFWFAFRLGLFSEVVGHLIRLRRPPHITRYAVSLIGRPTQFSIAKARNQLGWRPQVAAGEGLRATLEWYRNGQDAGLTAKQPAC